ncbi:MAG TPA: lysozyme inhibitor LprI family protein [Tahibacter sp.]|uniref:lysozyme inhibitor LprI family protein n=1 Tax=Tahibacter sp. TaxID=2056211 RepID=UPI002CA73772|nr:lysozyme inhibitor LprI family protein [Tahibacter sp.]HSX62100.1 lysozyme inhibitor LprI family protein [Tahibacter sp.]
MRTPGKILALAGALTVPCIAAAQCDYVERHAIAAAFAKDIERSGGVTVDMRDAQGRAYQAWDAELNRLYRELLATVKQDSDRDALRKAQRAWLAFHEAEGDWDWSGAMHGREGTSGPLNVAGSALTRLQQRICDLRDALDIVALHADE